MKGKIEEMKNTMVAYHSRFEEAEERIQELEDRISEILHTMESYTKRMEKYEQGLRELSDNTKCTNIHMMGVPDGEERGKGAERIIEEIITENF